MRGAVVLSVILSTGPLSAAEVGLSLQGAPGHIWMPSGQSLADGRLAVTGQVIGGKIRRSSLNFQISPRVSGAFRYAYLQDYATDGSLSLYDRSFDLRFQLSHEDPEGWQPAVALGLQDFGGTGIYGGEYLVASRHFGPRVLVSAGVGWGRYGSYGGGRNPLRILSDRFLTRPETTGVHDTGKLALKRMFRGTMAPFFGLDWQATDKMRLSLEHSSDGMTREVARLGYKHRSPLNFGLSYRLGLGDLNLAWMNGATLAVGYSLQLRPQDSAAPSGREAGPPALTQGGMGELQGQLKGQGIEMLAFSQEAQKARLRYRDAYWTWGAQGTGRALRVMARSLPPQVETFEVTSDLRGMAMRSHRVQRADLMELEYAPDGAWGLWARTQDAMALPPPAPSPLQFGWRVTPWVTPGLFDPDNPLRADGGLELSAEISPWAGFWVSGALRAKALGNLDEAHRTSPSDLPVVRSDTALYFKDARLTLPWLVAEHFQHLPRYTLYTRASLGWFETAYGGASAEVLWAKPGLSYAFGLELNALKKRDYTGLGFQGDVIFSGHASGYADLGRGYRAQLDVGRYLAGDWGATLRLSRQFGNGVEIGAFATLTNAGFDAYGEGAFDKGITLSLPLHVITGRPSQRIGQVTLRPILRDGGARVEVPNRLYALTARERAAANGEGWGRVWR